MPALSVMVPPLSDRASAPAYSKSPARSPGSTVYTNASSCEPLPESYEARPPAPPVSSDIRGDPAT